MKHHKVSKEKFQKIMEEADRMAEALDNVEKDELDKQIDKLQEDLEKIGFYQSLDKDQTAQIMKIRFCFEEDCKKAVISEIQNSKTSHLNQRELFKEASRVIKKTKIRFMEMELDFRNKIKNAEQKN
jgi:hypothetical protein